MATLPIRAYLGRCGDRWPGRPVPAVLPSSHYATEREADEFFRGAGQPDLPDAGGAQGGQGLLRQALQHFARRPVALAAKREDELVDADGPIALDEFTEGLHRGPGVVLSEPD